MLNPKTQLGRMYLLLSTKRRQRVSILELHKVSGSLAISTKISELRNKYNLQIENRIQRQKDGMVFSWFKLKKGQIK